FEPYHGPGGAQTLYNADFADPDADAAVYRGKYYYNYDKCYTRINTLIQGKLQGEHLRWLAGLYLLSTAVDTIDYTDYDEDPGQTLLANHWDYRQAAMAGGQENALVAGIIYDRRDHEATPHRGVWSELLVRWIPDALGNDFSYTAITATHRQYLPISNELTFAYRLSGRSISAGAPFFSTPQVDGTYKTEEGLGGKKTVRGVLWQRVNGFNAVYGNLELRYRVMSLLETGYAALSIFYDLGRTFDEIPESTLFDRGQDHDVWHQGVGGGVRIAPNNTFIVALDLAVPVDSAMDGPGLKVYVGLDWLF
ncbi:MAG: BamA/TamA family outer membrane protein, partial [Candidatus Marinimicrobia bacterium]|nr:BamA/TamA family outer membrane protein [Candidatus Neomarinimicrobiota bacterium]